jgi:tetratricopeptide (TPR) repeat protein
MINSHIESKDRNGAADCSPIAEAATLVWVAMLSFAAGLMLSVCRRRCDQILGPGQDAFLASYLVFVPALVIGLRLGMRFPPRGSLPFSLLPFVVLGTISTAVAGQRLAPFLNDFAANVASMRRSVLFDTLFCTVTALALEFLPALGFGAILAAVTDRRDRADGLLQPVNRLVYLFTFAGGVLGLAAGSQFLIPRVSTLPTLVISLLLLVVIWLVRSRRSAMEPSTLASLSSAGIVIYYLGTGLGADYSYGSPAQSAGIRTRFFHVGRSADVRLREIDGQVQLQIDGAPVAGTGARLASEIGLACIPRLLRPRADRVFVVGFGSGAASGRSLMFPGTKVVCAEPEPAVVAAAMKLQNLDAPSILSSSFSLALEDARASLLSRANAYDLVLVNYGDPHIPEAQKMWTKQFYASAKLALSPNGLLAQRLALSAVSPAELALLSRTLISVFPHCGLLRSSVSEILLVGSSAPLIESSNSVCEAQDLVAGLPDIQSALRQHFGTADVPTLLLTQFWLDEKGLRAIANSDGERSLLTGWNWRFHLHPVYSSAAEKTEREFLLRDLITGNTTPSAFDRWSQICGCPSSKAAAACHPIAEQFFASGQPKQALDILAWGLGLDPEQPDLLADCLIGTKEEDIEIIVRDATVIEKRSVAAANRVAVSLCQRALNRQAIAVLFHLTQIAPQSATLWAHLAVVYRTAGELKRAEECLDDALALDPLNEFVQRTRGDLAGVRAGPSN